MRLKPSEETYDALLREYKTVLNESVQRSSQSYQFQSGDRDYGIPEWREKCVATYSLSGLK